MPLTAKKLEEYSESLDAVGKRRLVWTATEILRSGNGISRSAFLVRTFVPKSLTSLAYRVFDLVEEALLAGDPVAHFQSRLPALMDETLQGVG